MTFSIDAMQSSDWEAVRDIYEEGIRTRNATFETEVPDWEGWDTAHLPFARLVAREAGEVLGWAALSPVSRRACYAGVAEASIYVAQKHWRRGVGRALLAALIAASEHNGVWTLQASIFPENLASLALIKRCGFREIGRRQRIARLDGVWRDTLILERRSAITGA